MGYTLLFDTETTGFVQKDYPPDHPSQPHLVQLGMILADDASNEIQSVELIVRPEGYEIPKQASDVHKIYCQQTGARHRRRPAADVGAERVLPDARRSR